jgi:hypothetical protein
MMEAAPKEKWVKVTGVVECGHGVASGQASDSPYPDGTINMQIPFFKELGLDLTAYYAATLNVSIKPFSFAVINPEYTFRDVEWTQKHPPEHFSFSRCRLTYQNLMYDGWIYYPHPETKKRHFQNTDVIEIISPYIPHLDDGNKIEIFINAEEIQLNMN